jgi:hypothetical protein
VSFNSRSSRSKARTPAIDAELSQLVPRKSLFARRHRLRTRAPPAFPATERFKRSDQAHSHLRGRWHS